MRISRRWVAGMFAAALLLPVPTLAIQQSVARKAISARKAVSAHQAVSARQAGSSATQVIFHQNQERRTYVVFATALRREFRNSGTFLRASTNRYLQDLLLDLRAHWRVERRTGVVSPFEFPDL